LWTDVSDINFAEIFGVRKLESMGTVCVILHLTI